MFQRHQKLEFSLLLMIQLLLISSTIGTRARISLLLVQQQEFDPTQLLPIPSPHRAQSISTSLQQQHEVLSYLMNYWDIGGSLEKDLVSTIEIICQAVIALNSVQTSSELVTQIYSDFDLILAGEFSNLKESLKKSTDNLFYVLKGNERNVSSSLNLWIINALLSMNTTFYPDSIEMAHTILKILNSSVRGETYAAYFRKFVLLDDSEIPIPGSISPISLLKDQILAMTAIQTLSHKILDEIQVEVLRVDLQHLESIALYSEEGFLDINLELVSDFSFGFLHAQRNSDVVGDFYQDNRSYSLFKDRILLLDYFFRQFQDLSRIDNDRITDLYDLVIAEFYQDFLIRLLTDVQVLFRYENTLYHSRISILNIVWTIGYSDRIYMSEQFNFIRLLTQMAEWFVSSTPPQVLGSEQLHQLAVELWSYLADEAYNHILPSGQAASINENVSVSVGYFYAFYSVSMGLYLFDNTPQGSLLFANLLAYSGLGTIFPFQLNVEYNNPLTVRDNQSLLIRIVPLGGGLELKTSGDYIDVQLSITVPAESLDTVIAKPKLSVKSNYSIRYNFSISNEGPILFSIQLLQQQAVFFSLDASFQVLRTMMLDVQISPTTPMRGDPLEISLEVQDKVGFLREKVQYFAKINSETWSRPIWFTKQPLFFPNGTKNSIFINQTQSDLYCYFLVLKDGYYPVETNMTIHFQTGFNFFIEWLIWLVFESEIGAWVGTFGTVLALIWAVNTRILNRALRRVKTCPYCGSGWRTKYPVCAHCGRDLKPSKTETQQSEEIEDI